jgi:hypothetical protein
MNIFDKVAIDRSPGATPASSQIITLTRLLAEREDEITRLSIEHSKMLDQMQGMQHCMDELIAAIEAMTGEEVWEFDEVVGMVFSAADCLKLAEVVTKVKGGAAC